MSYNGSDLIRVESHSLWVDTGNKKQHIDFFRDQIAEPRHCWLRTPNGVLLHRNRTDDNWMDNDLDNPLRGQPIRFTRIAAERTIATLQKEYGIKAEITPCLEESL